MMQVPVDGKALVLSLLPKHGVGAEIGVHKGGFSQRILNVAKPRRLVLIDPWMRASSVKYARSWYGGSNVQQEEMEARFQGVMQKFRQHVSKGIVEVVRKTSLDAAPMYEDNFFDFVYIDGDHAYDGVMRDLTLFYGKIKPGGLIVGDDYRFGGWWGDGVVKAFNEFIGQRAVYIVCKFDAQIVLRKELRVE